jgi:pyruvate dehydrogenase E1 component alpha subunit
VTVGTQARAQAANDCHVRVCNADGTVHTDVDDTDLPVDGNDLEDCIEKSAGAIDRARRGDGPTFLEFKTYRVEGHCMVINDLPVFRPREEVERWAEHDPIKVYSKRLIEKGVMEPEEMDVIQHEIKKEFEEAIRFGSESPSPDADEFLKRVERRYAL